MTFKFRTVIALALFATLSWPAHAQIVNPLQAAKDAYNKAKQQKQGQQPAPQQQSQKPGQPQSASAVPNTSGPFTAPPGTKVDQTLASPNLPGSQFLVSPHGVHMATAANSGSRRVIIYDGLEGPKFDQIFGLGASLSGVFFSPDGNHYAYCARSGSDFVVMADGKELFRDSKVNSMGTLDDRSCSELSFTSNSKHVYFLSWSRMDPSHDSPRFVFDGQASPPGADPDLRNYAFSPDGDHYAYIWSTPTNNVANIVQKLIIDGKPAPYFGADPLWSTDSRHLYTTMRVSRPRPEMDILFDGKLVMRADFVKLSLSPVGNMGIATVAKNIGVPVPSQFLVINGKVVPGSEHSGMGINYLTFSPDGKHYACAYTNPNGRTYVFNDGKKGLEYARLDPFHTRAESSPAQYLAFTGDSSKVVYVADNAAGGIFPVMGDQESPEFRTVNEVAIDPVGGHVLVAGVNQITLDGKPLPLTDPGTITFARFSPDGSHYAFAGHARSTITLYFDGIPQSSYGMIKANQNLYTFSPDGKHIAYFCNSSNPAAGNDEAVCLDGKYLPQGPGSLENITFSADSNHVFWIKRVPIGFRMFADNKPVLEGGLPSTAGFFKETWQPDGNGGMLVLMHDATGYKRVSITPSSDASVSNLSGTGAGMVAGR